MLMVALLDSSSKRVVDEKLLADVKHKLAFGTYVHLNPFFLQAFCTQAAWD